MSKRKKARFKVGDEVVVTNAHPMPSKRGQKFVIEDVRENGDGVYYMGAHPTAHAGVFDRHVEAAESAIDPGYYQFPGGHAVRHISAHLTSFGGQAVQYIARSTRLDGKNKGDSVENIDKAIKFLQWERERLAQA